MKEFLLVFLDNNRIVKDCKVTNFEIIIDNYINKYDNYVHDLQDFIGEYLKKEYNWMTSVGLIEAMDKVIESVKEEGYIK
jgi:hypothetical protein